MATIMYIHSQAGGELVKVGAGSVVGLAAAGPAGPVIVAALAGRHETLLTAIDLAERTLWQHTVEGPARRPRIGPDGTVWAGSLTGLGLDGSVVATVPLDRPGSFVVLPDGFCLARRPSRGGPARLARATFTGDTVWSTELALDELSYPGVMELSVDSGWQPRAVRPWRPRSVDVAGTEPLLVSGDRVLVHLRDDSGIGVCFLVDLTTGHRVATLPPAPYQHKAIVGPGRFLVGCQGYGAFSCFVIDREGRTVQGWPSHGLMLVDRHGSIRGPEFENVLPSRSRFRVLNPDGSMGAGPALTDYYTTYPALDVDGNAVFWRDGRLLVVDADLRVREISTGTVSRRTIMSRVLLMEAGRVVFALGDEVLFWPDTGLGLLDSGPWPCGDANLQGNPVVV